MLLFFKKIYLIARAVLEAICTHALFENRDYK
jgi:hypothetical protein